MMAANPFSRSLLTVIVALGACGGTSKGGAGGAATSAGGSGGTSATSTGTSAGGGAVASGGNVGSGGTANGRSEAAGSVGTGGVAAGGRMSSGGSAAGGNATGGGKAGSAGTGGATAPSSGQDAAMTGGASGGCTVGTWPTADPSKAGPFATTTENNVGPQAGVVLDSGVPPQFTMFRPKDLTQGGLCFPVITWGNGHGCTPSYCYSALLTRLASHGFVVIASDSPDVSQGSPLPMLTGVTWVLQENADPTSELYQRIDTTHIGAAGHSEGAFATTSAASDSHIITIAPICGASAQRNLHGPALFLCGGQDTVVGCGGSQSALAAATTQPAMVAEYISADHQNWVTYGNAAFSPMEVAVVAWMRVQLMGDTALRPRFYGASCTLCQDSTWQITQNSLMSQ